MALLSSLSPEPGRRIWTICQATALAFCIIGFAFAAVSTFLVKSYCIVCIATYAVNFALLFFSWIIRRRFHAGGFFSALAEDARFLWSKRAVSAPLLVLLAVGLTATAVAFPAYWKLGTVDRDQGVGGGLTEDGAPYIGAADPLIEIVEFMDYQCFQCRKMHYYLRTLVARYPEQIRLTHRNYPMDHEVNPIVTEPFHIGSGRIALLAVHAAMTGRFLEMNDLLFRKASEGNDIDLDAIRRETGDSVELGQALAHPPYREHLLRDIRYGMKLRVMGTPAFLIDGKVFTGSIPAEVLKALVDKAEAASASATEAE
jgi:protein-disulfide isomerase